MHHCLAAEPLSSSLWWEGCQVNTWAWMPAVRSVSMNCGWQDGRLSWAHPQDWLLLKGCVPTSKGWSDFKRPPCLLIWGTGELPGWGMHSPETSGFSLAVKQVGSWQQWRKLQCADLPMCFAQRGWVHSRVDGGIFFMPPSVCTPLRAGAREDAQCRVHLYSRSWTCVQAYVWSTGLMTALLSQENRVKAVLHQVWAIGKVQGVGLRDATVNAGAVFQDITGTVWLGLCRQGSAVFLGCDQSCG